MKLAHRFSHRHLPVFFFCLFAGAACAGESKVSLSGDQEVPPVVTSASGSGSFFVSEAKAVSGSVTTTGVTGSMAHIHHAATGKNGPVVVPLLKSGDNSWVVPAGAALTDEQYTAYKAGELYVNVHSQNHPGGEIRAQIKP